MKTIVANFDQNAWLYLPESWPSGDFADIDALSGTVGRLMAEYHGVKAKAGEALSAGIRTLALEQSEFESRFVYLASPFEYVFFVSVLQAESAQELTLEDLAAVGDPAVVRPPETDVFVSPTLGEGIRSIRYADTGGDEHSIAVTIQYAWRSEGLDVVVIASSFDVVQFIELRPIIDEFALSIAIVDA
ncbi:hypothetical protein B0I08_108105 [Glaciihabitans tibetensis]|uniref:Uncharacterized protein n=1 Tax=Glaciihabitans tibetensis TaxID=1266600 RepID=A0A2T0VA48_9MICO|nr:hypothetical protein [Glaciihabitans tibetensis]PRY67021.1 hypothetical protein B0I08_108105 [Glaciihabitans tibetensis]